MNPIKMVFQQEKTFVGFVMACDGGIDYCVECCLQLIEGGVDILEIGFPFSDPVADGPVIQRAAKRSLGYGASSKAILEIARRIRARTGIPLILFTYYNPLLRYGSAFLGLLQSAGFNAVLVVDLPPPEINAPHPYFDTLKKFQLHPIFLVSPSTNEQRLEQIVHVSESFIYFACQKGTTGVRKRLPDDFSFHISRIREKTALPIAAGFGIADRTNAEAALRHADAFVVGSAFVNLMEQKADPLELKSFAKTLDPRK